MFLVWQVLRRSHCRIPLLQQDLLTTLIAFLSVASLSAQKVRDRNNMKIGTANGVNMYHTAVCYFFNLL